MPAALMKASVLVAVLFVCGSSLPLEQRRDAPEKQQPFPGLDKEEFKRYWEDAVKNNPGTYVGLCTRKPVFAGGK